MPVCYTRSVNTIYRVLFRPIVYCKQESLTSTTFPNSALYSFVTGSLAVRPQPGHTPHLLPTFAISVLYLALAGALLAQLSCSVHQ